jgi:hypothetical protein
MSVIEPSDAVNAGMAIQIDGSRLALSLKSPPSISSLVGWFNNFSFGFLTPEDGTDMLSRNFGKKLPLLAA